MKTAFLFMTALLLFLPAFTMPGAAEPALQPQAIATVAEVSGDVYVTRQNGLAKQPVTRDLEIFPDDKIETTAESRVILRFIDGTSLTMADAGSLGIDEYVFDPQNPQQHRARFNILRASFSFVSGLIGRRERPDIQLDLDFGSLGIRGTSIWRTMQDGECWIFLEDGMIDVSNQGGSVTLAPGLGTRLRDKAIAPTPPERWTPSEIKTIREAVSPHAP